MLSYNKQNVSNPLPHQGSKCESSRTYPLGSIPRAESVCGQESVYPPLNWTASLCCRCHPSCCHSQCFPRTRNRGSRTTSRPWRSPTSIRCQQSCTQAGVEKDCQRVPPRQHVSTTPLQQKSRRYLRHKTRDSWFLHKRSLHVSFGTFVVSTLGEMFFFRKLRLLSDRRRISVTAYATPHREREPHVMTEGGEDGVIAVLFVTRRTGSVN